MGLLNIIRKLRLREKLLIREIARRTVSVSWTLQLPTNVFGPEKGLDPEDSPVIRCLAPSVKRVRLWGRIRFRLNTEFHLPKSAGKSRHGQPVGTIQSTASTKAEGRGQCGQGHILGLGNAGRSAPTALSVDVVRIKVASYLAALNQSTIGLEILKRQHALERISAIRIQD